MSEPGRSGVPTPDRDVADALGYLCEGIEIEPHLYPVAWAALAGPVETDRGSRCFCADLEALLLNNIDTEEAIWGLPGDGVLRGVDGKQLADLEDQASARAQHLFPLWVLRDSEGLRSWHQAMQRGNHAERKRWARFLKRVLKPLARNLGQAGYRLDISVILTAVPGSDCQD